MVVDEKLRDHQRYQYNHSWSACHGTLWQLLRYGGTDVTSLRLILIICWTDLTFCFVLFWHVWNTNVHSFMDTHSLRCIKQGLCPGSFPFKTQPLWTGRTITPRYNWSMFIFVPGYYFETDLTDCWPSFGTDLSFSFPFIYINSKSQQTL